MKGTACAPRRTELHAQCMTDGVKDAGCYQVPFQALETEAHDGILRLIMWTWGRCHHRAIKVNTYIVGRPRRWMMRPPDRLWPSALRLQLGCAQRT